MPRDFAAFSALRASREAIAAISLQSPFCMPGMTFLTAMDATPSTPHFTLPCFTAPPCDSSTLPFITQLGQRQYFEWPAGLSNCFLDLSGEGNGDAPAFQQPAKNLHGIQAIA